MYWGLIDGVDMAFKIILFALDIRILCTEYSPNFPIPYAFNL